MAGRHGFDALSLALLVLALIMSILGRLFRWPVMSFLVFLPLILCYVRAFSRNHEKRYAENAKFLAIWMPLWSKLRGRRGQTPQSGFHPGYGGGAGFQSASSAGPVKVKKDKKNYAYFRCKNCKQELRVPRGKGKVKVTCPKCKTQVVKKT